MARITNANLDASGHTLAIIVARFNSYITSKLLEGAVEAFERHGGRDDNLHIVHVPGAFEIPTVAQKLANKGGYSAIVCLGAVIRGETSHYDYVCTESARGVAEVARTSGIPVINGILTTNNVQQAIERAGLKGGNKGADVTIAAIEMVNIMQELDRDIR